MNENISPQMLANLQKLMWQGGVNFELAKVTAESLGCWEAVLAPLKTLKNYSYGNGAYFQDTDFIKTTYWEFKGKHIFGKLAKNHFLQPPIPTLPENITQLRKLQWLNAHHIGLESLPENLLPLKRLERLIIANNQLKSLPASLFQLKKLHTLDAHSNQIETLPANFWEGMNSHINHNCILLSKNALQTLPEIHAPTANISLLDFSHNRLTELFQNFKYLRGIHQLKLSHNQLKTLPESIGNVPIMHLYVSNNQLKTLPESIGNAPIMHLFVSNNQLKTLPESLFKNPKLKLIDARNNFFNLREQKKIYQWANENITVLL